MKQVHAYFTSLLSSIKQDSYVRTCIANTYYVHWYFLFVAHSVFIKFAYQNVKLKINIRSSTSVSFIGNAH